MSTRSFTRTTERFHDAASGNEGLVRRFTSSERFPPYADFSLTAGVQYELTRRLSAGVFVWANAGNNLLLEAPFGVEVRWVIGDRR